MQINGPTNFEPAHVLGRRTGLKAIRNPFFLLKLEPDFRGAAALGFGARPPPAAGSVRADLTGACAVGWPPCLPSAMKKPGRGRWTSGRPIDSLDRLARLFHRPAQSARVRRKLDEPKVLLYEPASGEAPQTHLGGAQMNSSRRARMAGEFPQSLLTSSGGGPKDEAESWARKLARESWRAKVGRLN